MTDELVQHGAEQRRVRPGPHPEEQVGGAGQRHHPGILHDEPRSPVPGTPHVAGGDGERLGHVRPGHPHHVGERDVAPRVGGPVDAERLAVAGARRHHAVTAVVVEVRRLQRQARELADQIALLVGERNARQHGHGVVAVCGLDAADLADHPVEGVVPGDRAEPAGRGGVTLQGMQQPVGVAALEVALHALGAQLALVEGELVPGLEADHGVVADLELDPALLAAEAAVGADHVVGLDTGVPAAGRGPVEVRTVAGDELLLGDRCAGHQPKPPTRADWASATCTRRHRGQVSW